MPDQIFYLDAKNRNSLKPNGYAPSKFLTINGQPVVDPMPGGSHVGNMYTDDRGSSQTAAAYGNPNNYLIDPNNFNEQRARDYASRISATQKIPGVGIAMARARTGLDFRPEGSEDLQRAPQWNVPANGFVPAYVSSASHYLGFVSGLTDTPVDLIERVAGPIHGGPFRNGPHGVSWQNHLNLVKGYGDATAMPNVERITNDFRYGPPAQAAAGQVGDGKGVANWVSSLYDVDPSNPTQPVAQQQTEGPLGLVSNKPMPNWPVPPPIYKTR